MFLAEVCPKAKRPRSLAALASGLGMADAFPGPAGLAATGHHSGAQLTTYFSGEGVKLILN